MREGVLEEIQQLISRRKLIEAIKRIREETRVSLREAKEAAEALQRGETVPALLAAAPPARDHLTMPVLEEVKRLADQGATIEAIKRLRAVTSLSLKEAKESVEALQCGLPVPHLSLEVAGAQSRCPSCGAVIGPASLKWISPFTAECLYCGGLLRPGGDPKGSGR